MRYLIAAIMTLALTSPQLAAEPVGAKLVRIEAEISAIQASLEEQRSEYLQLLRDADGSVTEDAKRLKAQIDMDEAALASLQVLQDVVGDKAERMMAEAKAEKIEQEAASPDLEQWPFSHYSAAAAKAWKMKVKVDSMRSKLESEEVKLRTAWADVREEERKAFLKWLSELPKAEYQPGSDFSTKATNDRIETVNNALANVKRMAKNPRFLGRAYVQLASVWSDYSQAVGSSAGMPQYMTFPAGMRHYSE